MAIKYKGYVPLGDYNAQNMPCTVSHNDHDHDLSSCGENVTNNVIIFSTHNDKYARVGLYYHIHNNNKNNKKP